ncbi:FAD binding domain-containing protein [Pisolithus croceorrhizus]|nr:FAD binding domain-containing protein [Pisolithus croceorrhizus]KAI6099523.1 FAD binding domain-containing protein [Pisolithus croceorrhizus]
MTTCTAPVLVVGAGPSGIAAALTLARNNVPVRIIEKESQHRRGQRGAGIQPRTFEVFHFLGVPEVHERASPVLPIQEHNRGSLEPLKTFRMIDYAEPTPAIPYFNSKMMGQPTLEAIMREHLAQHGCTIELGTRLISFSQDEKCVRAKVVKHRGDTGEEVEEDIEAAYLIGADGARGVTRKQLQLTFLGTTRQDDFLVLGDIRLEVEGLDRTHWHMFGQTSYDVITLRPTDELGKDGWQFIMSSRSVDLQGLVRDEEALVNRIKDFVGIGDDVKVKEVMWASEFRPNMRMVNKFGVGRIFVAGDAAHVHSPAGGQGLNSSVQDAFNIAWKIALVYKGLSPASLLDTYTAERLPVIAEMLGVTTEMHKLMFDGSGVKRTPQSIADVDGNSESDLERGMRRGNNVYMLGVNYRSSPIVVDEFTPAPGASDAHSAYGEIQEGVLRAGDRAPDAPGLVSVITPNHAPHLISSGSQLAVSVSGGTAGSTRMFDIFGSTHHTVIIFAPALAVPAVRSILVTSQQVVPKELVRRVVVLPGSASEPDSRLETSSEGDQTIEVEVLVDHAGHAYRGYIVKSQEVKVVVVRPDGVVGAIVRGVTGLERYFEGVFGKKGGILAMEDAEQI